MAAGTFGTAGKRSLPVTASALSWPPCTWPSTAETVSNRTSTCLPSSAEIASGEVRNGTCSMSTAAVCLNSSAARCWVAPKPGLANTILPGLALAASTSSLMLLAGIVRARHDQEARGRDLGDRVERGARVVAQRLVHHRRDDLAGGHDADRVAVLGRVGDQFVADRASRAGLVLDHDRLAELLLHALPDDAADDVGAAARPERDDQADRLGRIVLRRCRRGEARGKEPGGCDRRHSFVHGFAST